MGGKWLRITTEENAIDYLEKAADFIQGSDKFRWKWVAISLHAALYAFAICALYGTNPDCVLSERKKRTMGRNLISFKEALGRCQQSSHMLFWVQSKVLTLSSDEIWAIDKLSQTLRNNFEHYQPKSWSIEVSGMPLIVKHVCRVIRFLVLESGNLRAVPLTEQRRMKRAFAILEQNIG